MSADNGIYILKTKDGLFKVIKAQAFDLHLSWMDEGFSTDKIQPARLFQYFWNCKGTKNEAIARQIASTLYKEEKKEHGYVEYGIRTIQTSYTWNKLEKIAKSHILVEMNFLKNHPSTFNDCQLKQLQAIVM